MSKKNDFDNPMQDYRTLLETLQQKSQADYDKTVLALSGGALGISFAFVKDFIGESPIHCPWLLFYAWIVWGVSISAMLFSFFFSNLALTKAIKQIDENKIRIEHPGGFYDKATACLNIAGGVLFLAGVILSVLFVAHNLGVNHGK